MSFTKTIKDECSRAPMRDPQLMLAELAAIARFNGTILMQSFCEPRVRFTTSNHSVARRIFLLIKRITGVEPEISSIQSAPFQKKLSFQIVLEDVEATHSLLVSVGLLDLQGNLIDQVPAKLLWGLQKSRSFLRGAFLVSGYVASPEKAHHLEIEAPHEEQARLLRTQMKKFKLNAKLFERKEASGLYLKDGEQIAEFLNVIEAHQSLLAFEDARAMKDMRNQINRKINFETANLDKTVDASMKQVALIKELDKKLGLQVLDDTIAELARLRVKHPSATLKELGEMCDPPIGKSGVNHRFRKLMRTAEELLMK